MAQCLEKIQERGSAALQKELALLIKRLKDRSVFQKIEGK